MATTKKTTKTVKKTQRQDFHHLGSPEFFDSGYHMGNMEITLAFKANGSNTHFLNGLKDVQMGDDLLIGLTEQDAESLVEDLIKTLSDRFKMKLERYNEYKKLYWMRELEGEEKEWDKSNWNSFNNQSN